MTIPTGNLVDGCYDEAGNLYRLPEVIVLDPTNAIPTDVSQRRSGRPDSNIDGDTMIGLSETKSVAVGGSEIEDDDIEEDKEAAERRREDKGKGSERDAVKVQCRLSDRGGPDVVILLGKNQNVGALSRRVHAEADVSPRKSLRGSVN